MTSVDFSAKMKELRIEELLQIATSTDGDGFEPQAVSAAQNEIDRRNVPANELEAMKLDLASALEMDESRKPNEIQTMSNKVWILHIFLGIFLIPALVYALYLNFSGYTQKSKDVISAVATFWFFVFILIVLFVIFSILRG